MAILKHIASKNADYGEAQRYLIFQHDEYTGKPVLDENGNKRLGKNIILTGWSATRSVLIWNAGN